MHIALTDNNHSPMEARETCITIQTDSNLIRVGNEASNLA